MANEDGGYRDKLEQERARYKDVVDVNSLPDIFHYWSHTHLRPMVEEFGVSNPDQWFAKYLAQGAARSQVDSPVFISIGAGNCDTEVRVARLLAAMEMDDFVIECLDVNRDMLDRGQALAQAEGVADRLRFVEGDFNDWRPSQRYAGVMANQSLHHVTQLELLFDEIRRCLHDGAMFVASDIIGRNGHMRWPEALEEVHRFWRELPEACRYNHLLARHEELYENWDCSGEGFEGIRAQDILPLLLERFQFAGFVGFANIIDPFIDRTFGHNFDAESAWSRDFIDRIHQCDERSLAAGVLKPTHMFAAMTVGEPPGRQYSRGLSPQSCVRPPG
jgi:SAM-dependent methyltransferase